MNIQTELRTIPLDLLVNNTGQVEGVRANPRLIKDEDYKRLKKSLRESDLTDIIPLKVLPLEDGKFMTIGGNMRLRALQELGVKETRCVVIPKDTPAEVLNKAIILDNSTHGEWDFDMLANEWTSEPLEEWGVALPVAAEVVDMEALIEAASCDEAIKDFSNDTNYDLGKLYRKRINPFIEEQIARGVNDGEIREEIAEVLRTRATQCAIFNFDELIKFYRSEDATRTEKELLRRLYLVFVAPRELVENAIMTFKDGLNKLYDENLMDDGTDNADDEETD